MAHSFWRGYYNEPNPQDPDSVDMIVHKLTINNINFDGNAMNGSGSHAQFGNFVIEGTQNNGQKVEFKLKYDDRDLIFNGKQQGQKLKILKGCWGNHPGQDVGSWKFTLIHPKQGWNGSYEQGGIDYDMDFSELNIEDAQDGKVTAKGSDENGNFVFDGVYGPATQQIRLTKTYQHGVQWRYWGTVTGNVIEGNWGESFGQPMGSFRLFKVL